jgi:hypothetical protein
MENTTRSFFPAGMASIGMKQKQIPEYTGELKAQCKAGNQFSNFDRAFRSYVCKVDCGSKAGAQEKPRKMRARAGKKERLNYEWKTL